MKRTLSKILGGALGVLLCSSPPSTAQTYKSHLEHPIVRYKISARLDPAAKTVKGHYHLAWWNHTEDSIPELYFHLYLNAFKNLDSTFMRESRNSWLRDLRAEWDSKGETERWGWVDVDKVQIAGGKDLTGSAVFVHADDDNDSDLTLMRLPLP